MQKTSYRKGRIAEEKALKYLHQQGLKLLVKNYRTPRGEIDLIMRDGEVTVFIEVRSRKNNSTMNILETIDNDKRLRIIQAGSIYLQQKKQTDQSTCRFDIVLLLGELESAGIEWIKNAFDA